MEPQEWEHLFYSVVKEYTGLSRFQLVQALQQSPQPDQLRAMEEAFKRLGANEPIQYVLGYTLFMELKFTVGPGVLIPRPETEEWLRQVISSESKIAANHSLKILEIGTGSGCISLSLKHQLINSEVTAVDVSAAALDVARKNARDLGIECQFVQLDFLNEVPDGGYHILVSNPPYVRRQEAQLMRKNVMDYEPHLALFVPDEDPLLFYRHLAKKGRDLLFPGGRIYLEINEYLSKEVQQLCEDYGYENVEIHLDLFNKPRWIRAIR